MKTAEFQARLRGLCVSIGITQRRKMPAEVARRIGVPYQTVYSWFSELPGKHRRPAYDNWAKLATLFGLTVDELHSGLEEKIDHRTDRWKAS
ncbi:MAG: helix-turn-helix transcriptional regulator [Rhodospirillaceae bacterium]